MIDKLNILEVLTKDDPKDVFEFLLLELIEYTGSTTGSIFILNILDNTFEKLYNYEDSHLPNSIDFQFIEKNAQLTQAINYLKIIHKANQLLVPLYREADSVKYCFGFLNLNNPKLTEDQIEIVRKICFLFNQSHKDISIKNLLTTINQPIGYKKSTDDYFDELVKLISSASQAPLVAIREYFEDTGSLICISHHGFVKGVPPDFLHDEIPVPYKQTIDEKKRRQILFGPPLDEFPGLVNEKISQIAILPILVGDIVWGIMSLATKSKYYFSDSEMMGFETIAHGIGVSINNYRNFQNAQSKIFQIANNAMLITGVEIAQAVQHEAKNILNESLSAFVGVFLPPLLVFFTNKPKCLTTMQSMYGKSANSISR